MKLKNNRINIKKSYVIFLLLLLGAPVLYSYYDFSYPKNDESFGSKSNNNTQDSYAKCSQISDCNTCGTVKTSLDGICYWCDANSSGKGSDKKSCQVYKKGANCSSDERDCGSSGKAAIVHKKINNN